MIIDSQRKILSKLTSVVSATSKPIIFSSILGKDSTVARTETPTRSSASPRRRGDGVDPGSLISDGRVGDGEGSKETPARNPRGQK